MKWSKNVTRPPMRLAPEEVGSHRDRAYPYADTGDDLGNYIRVTAESVTFIGQRGPIKEAGINGCQVDDIITFALGTIQTFNKKFPCRENSLAITKLQEALMWLDARRQDREDRGVEGKDEE
jgi:hypothetical protein